MTDNEVLIEKLENISKELPALSYEDSVIRMAIATIKELLSKKYVIEQIRWERDRAMEQLEANGLRFGHKDDYGWIPCSERLPEEDGNYYCHVVYYGEEDFESHDEYIVTFYKGKWLTHVLDTYKVLAWRKLPKPYSEVQV